MQTGLVALLRSFGASTPQQLWGLGTTLLATSTGHEEWTTPTGEELREFPPWKNHGYSKF